MIRLTLLLCIAMYAALMTLGEDRGQMRPGLARAVAEGRLGNGSYGAVDEAAPGPAPADLAEVAPKPQPEPLAQPVPEPMPEPMPEPLPETQLAADPILPEETPLVDVAPEPPLVGALEDPVFSLSSLGDEPIAGEGGTPLPEAVPEAEVAAATGAIWYVNASSVNVRATPSTEAAILDKLSLGEAALMVEQVDAEWARIVIQGDGLEGYVALRYLSPGAP